MTQSDAPLSSPSNLQSSGLSLADAEDDIPIAQTSRTAKSSRSASSAARHHRTPSRSADLALDPDRSTPSAMDRQSSSSFGPKSPSPLTPPKTRTGSTTADEHAFICEYAVCPFGFASQVALVQHKHDVHPPVVSIRTVLGMAKAPVMRGGLYPCPIAPCRMEMRIDEDLDGHVKSCAAEALKARVTTGARQKSVSGKGSRDGGVNRRARTETRPSPYVSTRPGPSHQPPSFIASGSGGPPAPSPSSFIPVGAHEYQTLRDALSGLERQLDHQRHIHNKTVGELQTRLGEGELKRSALEQDNSELRHEIRSIAHVDRRRSDDVAAKHAAEVNALKTERRALQDQLAALKSRPESARATDDQAKIDRLKKHLAAHEKERVRLTTEVGTFKATVSMYEHMEELQSQDSTRTVFVDRPPKRPFPSDPADASASSSGQPANKAAAPLALIDRFADVHARWKGGVTGSAQESGFKRNWINQLIPAGPNGPAEKRTCSLCAEEVYLGPKDLQDGASMYAEYEAHLGGQHPDEWDSLLDGSAFKVASPPAA